MGFRINTNLESLRLQRGLAGRAADLRGNFARLGSGSRIGDAGDDPAGLALTERSRSELRSLTQAVRNTQHGLDLTSGADSRLSETGDSLVRLRELAVQASNGTLSDSDRAVIEKEAGELLAEIDANAQADEVTGSLALDGSETIDVQTGTDAGDVATSPEVDATAAGLGIDGIDLSDPASARDSLNEIHDAIDRVAEERAELATFSRELTTRQESAVQTRESLSAVDARISSLDVALESAALMQNRLLSEAGIASLMQANAQPGQALRLLG